MPVVVPVSDIIYRAADRFVLLSSLRNLQTDVRNAVKEHDASNA